MEIFKDFSFEAAHRLPNVPETHKCGRLHGHSYHVRVYIKGSIDENSGWLLDFAEIKDVVKPVIKQLDHYYLNDISGLENPTSENICRWLWAAIKPKLELLNCIEVRETCTSGCRYYGD